MLEIVKIVEHSNARFKAEIEKAKSSKNSDQSRIERRLNETYFDRIARAVLGISHNLSLSDKDLSLIVAFPEALFTKMLLLGWGASRKQAKDQGIPPVLLQLYYDSFNDKYKFIDINKLQDRINKKPFKSLLLCHGLSPTSDTILLLADIGRTLRMSYSIGITDIKIMLADVTWIKYNRSINQIFTPKEFMNHLRVCLDKRKRIYRALKLDYKVFGISDQNPDQNNLSKFEIMKHSKYFRSLAELFWGEKSLQPHKEDILKIIGKPLTQIPKRDLADIPQTIARLIDLKDGDVANAIEDKLQSEFRILRAISELFSSFDEEVFLYYFAQYFAQTNFNDFLKIAPLSEEKFDQPFIKYAKDFDKITSQNDNITILESGYMYCPQYVLGKLQILPYTSISGDAVKMKNVEEFKSQTILIDDSYDNKLDKIIGVMTTTETQHKNRLLSDLLSFIHFLFQNIGDDSKKPILNELESISQDIYTQINSTTDSPLVYQNIYSDWIKSISSKDSVVPFHIIPYLWEEKDWNQNNMITKVSKLIFKLLEVVNGICE